MVKGKAVSVPKNKTGLSPPWPGCPTGLGQWDGNLISFKKVGFFNANSEAVLLGQSVHVLRLPEYCQCPKESLGRCRSTERWTLQAGGMPTPPSRQGKRQRTQALQSDSTLPRLLLWSDLGPGAIPSYAELLHLREGLPLPSCPPGSYRTHYLMNFPHIPWR